MTDWIRVDYTDLATWPAQDQHVEVLRLMGKWDGVDHWAHGTGAVRYINSPGFAMAGRELLPAGFGLGHTVYRLVEEPEDGFPERPDEDHADWWRPLEEPDAVR